MIYHGFQLWRYPVNKFPCIQVFSNETVCFMENPAYSKSHAIWGSPVPITTEVENQSWSLGDCMESVKRDYDQENSWQGLCANIGLAVV